MNWHSNINQKSYARGTSGKVAAEGVFVPSYEAKTLNEITLTAVNTAITG